MSYISDTKRRLKAALDVESKRSQQEFARREAEIEEAARKELADAEAIAQSNATDEYMRRLTSDASRIENAIGGPVEIGSEGDYEARQAWLAKADVTLAAVGRAISTTPLAPYWDLPGSFSEWQAHGLESPPDERHYMAVAAVRRLALSKMKSEEAAADIERQAARERALDVLLAKQADDATAKYAEDLRLQQKLEA